MVTAAPVLVALGLTLVVAACGGGGGDAKPTAANPTPEARTQAGRDDIRTADLEKTLQAATGAADSLPRFGSVTQSTNRDTGGVTTDRAGAAYDGTGLTITVTRADGSTLSLDTADAIEDSGADPDRASLIPGAARTLRSWGTSNVADSAATVGRIGVTTANDDSSDWLAGGYWLHLAGRNLLSTAPTVTHADMGAFVDGPELRSHPASLPDTGTARYEGRAAGAYVNRFGTRLAPADIAPGSTETGEFTGTATLTANFADNTISGCIGCKGDLRLGAPGTVNTPSDYQLRLGPAPVDAKGRFRASDVTLYSATVQRAGVGVTKQGGSWGGAFSNVPVATGEPRLVAGTFGGRAAWSDGSEGVYVGNFAAGRLGGAPVPETTQVSAASRADLNRRIAASDMFIAFTPRTEAFPGGPWLHREILYEGATLEHFERRIMRTGLARALPPTSDFEYSYQELESRRGVSLAKGVQGRVRSTEDLARHAYTALLQHSMFHLQASIPAGAESSRTTSNVYSIGARTGPSNPTVAATWTGVMAGFDKGPRSSGEPGVPVELRLVQGDAAVTIPDIADPRLDVAFTNITQPGAIKSHPNMTWTRLSIVSGGFGGTGTGIEGQFYGPNAEEVGGVFDRDDISGAFAAKR